jgi:hypothetical protein
MHVCGERSREDGHKTRNVTHREREACEQARWPARRHRSARRVHHRGIHRRHALRRHQRAQQVQRIRAQRRRRRSSSAAHKRHRRLVVPHARRLARRVDARQRRELQRRVGHPQQQRGRGAAPQAAKAFFFDNECRRLAQTRVFAQAAARRLDLHLKTDFDDVQRRHEHARHAAGQRAGERLHDGAGLVARCGAGRERSETKKTTHAKTDVRGRTCARARLAWGTALQVGVPSCALAAAGRRAAAACAPRVLASALEPPPPPRRWAQHGGRSGALRAHAHAGSLSTAAASSADSGSARACAAGERHMHTFRAFSLAA